MNIGKSLASGLAGSVALTLVHNFFKDRVSNAPHIDKLGMEALQKIIGLKGRDEKELYNISLFADILSNGITYSLISLSRKRPVLTGALVGIGLGIGSTTLPQRFGLNKEFATKTLKTSLMSVLYYMIGGATTGAVVKALR